MQVFRRHQKGILIAIVLFIGIPMLFFGLPGLGGGGGQYSDEAVAVVGGIPVMASDFLGYLDIAAQRQSQGGTRPTYQELHTSGMADTILEEMIDDALFTLEEQDRDFKVNRELLAERLQLDPDFQDENGNFNPATWNLWVKNMESNGFRWKDIYSGIQRRISRQVYMNTLAASANRVLDKDIEEQLLETATKIQVKFVKVEPKVEPAEEQLQAHYDENQESYKKPDDMTADFVAVPLKPEATDAMRAVLKEAKDGADFGALADEHSDIQSKNGGDMPWRKEGLADPDYIKPIFTLGLGESSDLIEGPTGFYIYKLEEERINEESQEREVHARQIYFRASLSEEDRAARVAQAQKLRDALAEGASFETAAADSGLEVHRTPVFNRDSTEVEGVPRGDVRQLGAGLAGKLAGEYSDVITARSNLYVAKLVSLDEGVVPPLEEVRERLAEDTINAFKQGEEYKAEVQAVAEKIEAEASSLEEAVEKFPELEMAINETQDFTPRDYLFQYQLFLHGSVVYDAVGRKEPGAMSGPLTGFLGNTFFVELMKRTEPAEEDKADWDVQRKQLRNGSLSLAVNELVLDYRVDLRERIGQEGRTMVTKNQALLDRILGLNQEEAPAAGSVETAPEDGAALEEGGSDS